MTTQEKVLVEPGECLRKDIETKVSHETSHIRPRRCSGTTLFHLWFYSMISASDGFLLNDIKNSSNLL